MTETIRPAALADSTFIFRLSMDPAIREMSTRTETFSFVEHDRWFRAKLDDPRQAIWIKELNEVPVAQIRYGVVDNASHDAEIAIAVSPLFQNQGHGKDLLAFTEPLAIQRLDVRTLVALVIKGNMASHRLFIQSHYLLVGDETRMNRRHSRFEKEFA